MTGSFLRRSLLTGGVVAVSALTAFAPVAQAGVNPNVATIRAQVHNGTLLQTHGVTSVCPQCMGQAVTVAPGSKTLLSTTTPVGYGADELAAAYHLPAASVGAAGGTIAIIDGGANPNLESDLATYRAQYGLPACTTASGCLKVTDLNGGPALPPDPSVLGKLLEEEVGVETSLDMDMASAACPSCNLIELQVPVLDASPSNQAQADAAMVDFGTAVNTAASLGATAVSMSYQYPSDQVSETGTAGRSLFHPGVAVLASSGDSGYEGNAHVGWPANLPWVTSVGGTSLYQTGSSYTNLAWSGAGSGCETDLPAAIGQPASVSANCGGHRAVSDVSADADPATGVAVFDTYTPFSETPYNWISVGGTSASSPFIGGLYARGGHTSQVMGPNTLYAAAKGAFADVTLGQNAPPHGCAASAPALCVSAKGWDGPTGIGTPNGLAGF
jgi:subtilase family serine protease